MENYSMAKTLEIVKVVVKNKHVEMEIKLCSSDAMSPSHSKLVKNFITDTEMTELLTLTFQCD
jgi:hypothetical protein